MVLEIIIIFSLVCITAYAINIIEDINKKNKSKISFKEAMDLVELPIITFYNENKKLNFLLDTGSNVSYINNSILPSINHKILDKQNSTFGIEGNKVMNQFCSMDISYREQAFNEEFSISNLDDAFNIIKQEDGVQLHGILGSRFFEKYRYVLDFKDLIAYIR